MYASVRECNQGILGGQNQLLKYIVPAPGREAGGVRKGARQLESSEHLCFSNSVDYFYLNRYLAVPSENVASWQ